MHELDEWHITRGCQEESLVKRKSPPLLSVQAERKNKNDHEEFYVKMIILLTKEQTGFNEILVVSLFNQICLDTLFLQTFWRVFSWSLTNVKKSNLLFETSFVPVNDKKCEMTRICKHTIASLFWSKSKNQIINCFNMPLKVAQ